LKKEYEINLKTAEKIFNNDINKQENDLKKRIEKVMKNRYLKKLEKNQVRN
jgi:hypothetical protein